MQYSNIGRSGLKVSRIGLGMMTYGSKQWEPWVLEEETAYSHVRHALELGINFFDTADMYSDGLSETITGKAIKKYARRDEVVIATKVFYPMSNRNITGGLSRNHILNSIDASLRRLQTDYIDLYQIHRWDYATPIEETLEALHDVVKAGKVRYIGASSMYAWQFCKSLYVSDLRKWTRFISMQNHYNLIYREEEREMIPLCRNEGIGVIPFAPLAKGILANPDKKKSIRSQTDEWKSKYYYQDNDWEVAEAVFEVAKMKNVPPAEIALAWLLRKPGVVAPIIGATKLKYIDEATDAVNIELSEEEIELLESAYRPHSVMSNLNNPAH